MQKTSPRDNQMQYFGNGSQNYGDGRSKPLAYNFSSTTPRPVMNVTHQTEPFPFSTNPHSCSYRNHHNNSEHFNVSTSSTGISRSRSIPHFFSESREGFHHWPSVPVLNSSQCTMPMNHQTQLILSPPNIRVYSGDLPHFEHHHHHPEIHSSANEHALESLEGLPCSLSHETLVCTHQLQHNEEVLMYKIMCEQKDGQLKILEQRLSSINDYLKRLPTTEQLQNLEKSCVKSESDKDYTINKYKELSRVLNDVQESLKYKNLYIEQLEKKNLRYQSKISTLNQYVLNLDSGEVESNKNVVQERDNLLAEIKLLKKKMSNYEWANDALQKKYSRDVEALRESLEEEENFQKALKTELQYKEETILSLKAQMKEADAKRNHLLENNLELEEKVKALSLVISETVEHRTLEKKLFRELRVGVAELKAIGEIIEDQVSGRNPNMSVLLGNLALSVISDSKNHEPTNKSILKEVNEAEDLSKNLSKLREDLSDKYAEYLGSELKCLTQ